MVVSVCHTDVSTSPLSAPAPKLQLPFHSCAQHCGHDQGHDLALKHKTMEVTHKLGCFYGVILKREQFFRLVQSVGMHRAALLGQKDAKHPRRRGCLAERVSCISVGIPPIRWTQETDNSPSVPQKGFCRVGRGISASVLQSQHFQFLRKSSVPDLPF